MTRIAGTSALRSILTAATVAGDPAEVVDDRAPALANVIEDLVPYRFTQHSHARNNRWMVLSCTSSVGVALYDDTLFVVLKTARYDDATESVEFAELQVFVGPSFVVSVRHGVASALAEVRRAIECQPELLRCGPPAVLHAIIDHVVDDYEPVLIGLDKDVREIEAQVFTHEQQVTNPAERIYKLKREVLDFLRNAKPLGESLERLSRQSSQIPDDLTDYFRDVHDHLLRVLARVEDLNVLLSDVLNANLAQVGVRQNDDMRKMSAWLAIGAFPTVVGAIYGMNFGHMPELEHTLGYPIVLALTALVCFALYRRFKRAHWL